MQEETYEEPTELTNKNVIYWSEHYKRLEGLKEATAIRTKAKRFLAEDCIQYDKEKKQYCCKPILKYNSTTYHFTQGPDGFECSCQFYNQVCKKSNNTNLICSHLLALFLKLKIWNWNKSRQVKEQLSGSVD